MTVGERIRADCPSCGRNKWAVIRAEFNEDEDDGPVWSRKHHRILQCAACDSVVHQTDFVFSEDTNQYRDETGEWQEDYNHTIEQWPVVPKDGRARPAWLDDLWPEFDELQSLFRDTYDVLAADKNMFAAVGVRTIFDRASSYLGIDPALTFEEKLQALLDGGYIGETERDHLLVATDAGSAAAHRGWTPKPEDLKTALDIVESFIHRTFIVRQSADRLKLAIPKRPKRRPKKSTDK